MSIQWKLKGFVSDTIVYGIGSMFSRAFAFFLIPLYTHYLDKNQYANLILLQLIFTVISFFLALNSGVFFYYYEYKREKIKKAVFTNWIVYSIAASGLFVLLSAAFYPLIKPIFEFAENDQHTRDTFFVTFLLMIVQFFPYVIFLTYFNLLRINLKPKKAVAITAADAILVIIFVVYFLAFQNMGIRGVVLGQLIAKTILAVGILLVGFYKYFDLRIVSWALMKRIFVYSSPYFFSSTFLWVMNSSDKILGTQLLESQAQVAFLGLAMQITMPIMMLAGIVSQAYGPYVMSIRHEENAKDTYAEILSLVVFASVIISVMLLAVSPFLIDILADETFYATLEIIPLFAFATVISIIMNQICIGLNLAKKNTYIAVATIFGALLGFIFNLYLQPVMGIRAAGYSQIIAYAVTGIIVHIYSQKFMPIRYDFKWAINILAVMALTIVALEMTERFKILDPHHGYIAVCSLSLLILAIIGERKYKPTKYVLDLLKKRRFVNIE